MQLTWSQWTLVGCLIVSLLCVIVGVARAALAAAAAKARARVTQEHVDALDLQSAQKYVDRINADVASMPMLIERARASIDSMNGSLAALKLPEAVASLRAAAVAVKLLVSGN